MYGHRVRALAFVQSCGEIIPARNGFRARCAMHGRERERIGLRKTSFSFRGKHRHPFQIPYTSPSRFVYRVHTSRSLRCTSGRSHPRRNLHEHYKQQMVKSVGSLCVNTAFRSADGAVVIRDHCLQLEIKTSLHGFKIQLS